MKNRFLIGLIIFLASGIFIETGVYFLIKRGYFKIGQPTVSRRQIRGTVWGIDGIEASEKLASFGRVWIKLNLSWQEIEEHGWGAWEKKLNQADGMPVIVIIHSDSRKLTVCSQKNQSGDSCPPIQMADYRHFVGEAVKRADQRVKFWQIEPHIFSAENGWQGTKEQYLNLLKNASEIIKKNYPQSRIILSGIVLANLEIDKPVDSLKKIETPLNYIMKEGKEYFDILDMHLFDRLETVQPRVFWLKDKMKHFGYLKPIWSLEMSGPDLRVSEYTPDLQAQEVVKRFLTGFNAGVEKIIYFSWQDKEVGQIDPLAATLGLYDSSGQAKLAQSAFQTMVKYLAGFNYLKKLTIDSGVTGYQVSFPSQPTVFVFWADEPVTLVLPQELKSQSSGVDYLGNSIAIAKGKLKLSRKPIYLRAKN